MYVCVVCAVEATLYLWVGLLVMVEGLQVPGLEQIHTAGYVGSAPSVTNSLRSDSLPQPGDEALLCSKFQ